MCNNVLPIVLAHLLLIGSLVIDLRAELYEGSVCTLEDGSLGVCKKLPDCPERVKEVKEGKRTVDSLGKCGFDGFIEIVCCHGKPDITDKLTKRPAESACSAYNDGLRYNIFDGIGAKASDFPFVVALGYKNNDFDRDEKPIKYICGGSLISFGHVLTAAHCVHNKDKSIPVEVRLGNENLISTDKNVQRIPIKDIKCHPDYKIGISYNDVAILKLERDATMSRTVKPVCLQTKPLDGETMIPRTSLVVLGWGLTSYEEGLSKLLMRTAGLSIVGNKDCGKWYTGFSQLPHGLDDTIVCAIDRNESRRSDACQGDSGGPLLMSSDDTRDGKRVVAIVAAAGGCGTAQPGFYTLVLPFLDWIEEQVWSPTAARTNDLKPFYY